MEEEMRTLAENDTWDLVDAPRGVKSIRCMWVYKVNYNSVNSVNQYKAQLVAKGYVQTHDIDNDDTFRPVTKIATVSVLLAIVAVKGWHLYQMNVKNVFLQSELAEQVYIVQPPGSLSELNTPAVCQLKKSLYGLKQAP